VGDDLPRPLAAEARPRDGDEPLEDARLAPPATVLARLGPPLLAARAAAAGARFARREPDRLGHAERGLLERDLERVAQVAPVAAARREQAPQPLEDLAHRRGVAGPRLGRAERRMAETIVGRALVEVGEDVVGLAGLLEPVLGVAVSRI